MNRLNLNGDKIWFTADYHLLHTNVIKYDSRPFETVEQMTAIIIQNHNELVKPDDIVFNLGDFALGNSQQAYNILRQLNGRHILIKGNHEKTVIDNSKLRNAFEGIFDYLEITVHEPKLYKEQQIICLFHYPIHEWNVAHHGAWMLHGHSHGADNYDSSFKILNVGIMLNNYKPFSYKQIKDIMATKIIRGHH